MEQEQPSDHFTARIVHSKATKGKTEDVIHPKRELHLILIETSFKYLRSLNAFCRKMECILPQNGMRFAAKWKAFCRKMESVLPQNGN